MRNTIKHIGLALALSCLVPAIAFAQTTLPTTVEPGRVLPDLQQQTPIVKSAPPVELNTSPDAVAPAGADKVTFILNDLRVTGNKRVPTSDLMPLWQGKLGQKISLADIYGIANGITRMYRERGYLLSRALVPEQEVKDGTVEINLLEGFVSGYTVQGGKDIAAREQIEAYAKQIVAAGTLKSSTLEHYLLLMNDIPGQSVRAVLSPSVSTPGGADLTLVPTRQAVQGVVSIDNYGSSYLGPMRLSGTAQYNNLFNIPNYASVTALAAPEARELGFVSGSYRQIVGAEGTKVGGDLSFTHTNPSLPNPLDALNTKGDAYLARAVVEHPFIRERSTNLTGTASIEATRDRTMFAPAFNALETEDRLRVARVGATGSLLDTIGGYNTLSLQGSHGFSILGATEQNDLRKSRASGDPDFTKLTAEATRLQRLFGPFTALVGVTGQYSFDPLLSSEEFALGGTDYGRGYDFSQITGDHGVAGKVELAYNGDAYKFVRGYQLYTFYDIGEVWRRAPGAGQDSRDSLASVGLGSRIDLPESVRGELYVAKPLTQPVVSRGASDDHDLRLQGSLTKSF